MFLGASPCFQVICADLHPNKKSIYLFITNIGLGSACKRRDSLARQVNKPLAFVFGGEVGGLPPG